MFFDTRIPKNALKPTGIDQQTNPIFKFHDAVYICKKIKRCDNVAE